jgi:DnaK suppressor protein
MNSRQETLLALQAELKQKIDNIDQDLHSRKTSAKFDEQVVDRQNDDVLLSLKNRAKHELAQIERALLKIENNEYGHCEKCHGAISAERLDAIPFTALCKTCAATRYDR